MDARRLRVMNVGQVKIILHRPVEGTPKTATFRRSSTGKWYFASPVSALSRRHCLHWGSRRGLT